MSSFYSESIWTEALQDVALFLGRDGEDSEGRRIWNPKILEEINYQSY